MNEGVWSDCFVCKLWIWWDVWDGFSIILVR